MSSASSGTDPRGPPRVPRGGARRRLSALVWGHRPPELVLLHRGAQNAHTWDSVALPLGRPLMAIALPGHGHSDWRLDRDYSPQASAADVATQFGRSPRRLGWWLACRLEA